MPFVSIDPTTEETLAEFPPLESGGIRAALDRARTAFDGWRVTPPAERASHLTALAERLEQGKDAYARLMTREMGKPIASAVAEVEKCAWVCRYYAERGTDFLAPEPLDEDPRCRVEYQPLGAILAIMPWNFPFWQVIRCAAPTLMAGNVVLLKHAPNVPQCAIAIEGLVNRAGFPAGVFQNLFAEVDEVPAILDEDVVQGVSLTGSVRAGSAVARQAAERIKTTVLELGGSDPFVVMESADLDRAIETAVDARMINNGQSCIAAKRLILHEPIADAFQERFVERVRALVTGDPQDPDTEIGPLAREDLRDRLAEQVQRSIDAGARVLHGGGAPDRPGWFYEPTVLADIPDACPARDEELFGPVASLFRVPDLEAALALANETEFGLSAAIWTTDPDERDTAVRELVAGAVFVNGMSASDPRVPFGGVKRSGYGRELGPHAIREFVNIKTVWTYS